MQTPATLELDRQGVAYELLSFQAKHFTAEEAASELNLPLSCVFKTLLTVADAKQYVLCVVPGSAELNLKQGARAAGAKRLELAPLADLQRITGYLKGGCSPLGTKRQLPVIMDESARPQERITVSAGRRGWQLWMAPQDLARACGAAWAPLV